jgi:hypothetical protein
MDPFQRATPVQLAHQAHRVGAGVLGIYRSRHKYDKRTEVR